MKPKTEFQAKDIQKMFGFKKHRYDYIAKQIGISPDVEEVEGTGHTNLYSFRNACQFGFAHYANLQGLSPRVCRDMLRLIDQIDAKEIKIYGQEDTPFDLFLYFMTLGDAEYFAIGAMLALPPFWFLFERRGERIGLKGQNQFRLWFPEGTKRKKDPRSDSELKEEVRKARDGFLSLCSAYMAVNLGLTKKQVLGYAKGS